MKRESRSRYLIKSVVHASQIVAAFQTDGESLRLRDVAARTGLTRMTCFRLLFTLHQCGFLEKIGDNLYRKRITLRPNRKFVLGYAAHGQNAALPKDVQASLVRAAEREQFELIVVDNRYDSRKALRNADRLVKERVDLAIVFQADEIVAQDIASKFLHAGIPLIAIDIPHPGAIYFGADNYRAGVMAGHHLASWANKHWEGVVDEILILEVARAGSLPQARVRGMIDGLDAIRERGHRVVKLDGDGDFARSQEVVSAYLRTSSARRILIGAATDPSALGALRAFEEAGRQLNCVVVGQNCRSGRAQRTAVAWLAADRLGRLLPRALLRHGDVPCARHPGRQIHAIGSVHEAPARHPGERQQHLSERPVSLRRPDLVSLPKPICNAMQYACPAVSPAGLSAVQNGRMKLRPLKSGKILHVLLSVRLYCAAECAAHAGRLLRRPGPYDSISSQGAQPAESNSRACERYHDVH
jgi:ribose transport system substrate-binding protein